MKYLGFTDNSNKVYVRDTEEVKKRVLSIHQNYFVIFKGNERVNGILEIPLSPLIDCGFVHQKKLEQLLQKKEPILSKRELIGKYLYFDITNERYFLKDVSLYRLGEEFPGLMCKFSDLILDFFTKESLTKFVFNDTCQVLGIEIKKNKKKGTFVVQKKSVLVQLPLNFLVKTGLLEYNTIVKEKIPTLRQSISEEYFKDFLNAD